MTARSYDPRFHIVQSQDENRTDDRDWLVYARGWLVARFDNHRDAIAFAIRNSTPDFWE